MSFKVISFYEFKPLGGLDELKAKLLELMKTSAVRGTVILATEGFNASVSGTIDELDRFSAGFEQIFDTSLRVKESVHDQVPFRRTKVKIKREIVTLRRQVDLTLGDGTHVDSSEWNRLITDPETLVLDARNRYEVKIGRFKNARDPETDSFGDLPGFVEKYLDPEVNKKVAMYCTGGIRCEKFAPYLKQMGFSEVYQLRGGILEYLKRTPAEEILWEGECFVFDERVSVDRSLRKGSAEDLSADMKHPDR